MQGELPDVALTHAALQRWFLMLSPPKKKRRPRDPIRAARRTTVKELDALCRKVVFARDGNRCRNCGQTTGLLDWAHVLSRRHPKTRHDPENAVVLCRKCHMVYHDRPIEGALMIQRIISKETYDKLELRAKGSGRANNELTRLYLEAEAKKYGIVP